MTRQPWVIPTSSYRFAGWASISSGAVGFLATGSLILYIVLRSQNQDVSVLLNRFHDVGVIFQFLLLIPAITGLQKFSQQRSPGMSKATLRIGIVALSFVVLSLLLIFPKVFSDVLYMFPQGVFGLWLLFVNWGSSSILRRGLSWFGVIVGFGLALVGTFPLGYALFVDPIVLQMPAASAEAVEKIHTDSLANQILHQILFIGSFIGVLTLPIWTILLGSRLLRDMNIYYK